VIANSPYKYVVRISWEGSVTNINEMFNEECLSHSTVGADMFYVLGVESRSSQ